MTKLGLYTRDVKKKFQETSPVLNSKELVMQFGYGDKTITNQIMQSWETPYMRDLAKIAAMNGGKILEVGYGMGISTNFIQEEKIKKHYLIECHPRMILEAEKRFKEELKSKRLELLSGFWEDVVAELPRNYFDGILFDSCPLDKEVELFQFFPFFREAFSLLKIGGVFTYFSDEPVHISPHHIVELRKAGFEKIDFKICQVAPPSDCVYWQHNTIVAPIIIK